MNVFVASHVNTIYANTGKLVMTEDQQRDFFNLIEAGNNPNVIFEHVGDPAPRHGDVPESALTNTSGAARMAIMELVVGTITNLIESAYKEGQKNAGPKGEI